MSLPKITFIDEVTITGKTVLLRADFDVSLHPDFTIADDLRIKQNLPTIKYILKNKNKLICIAKLGRPKKRDKDHSLKVVAERLHEYLQDYKVILVDDFLTDDSLIKNQKDNEIILLENIRFYPEEKENSKPFGHKLAALADIYVNDAFSMCHRKETSITMVPTMLPSYGGLLLKREITNIHKAVDHPKKPVVSIIGGAKISTKVPVLHKLITISDYILVGGALANVFLVAEGYKIGKSLCEMDQVDTVKRLISYAKRNNTKLMIPTDVITKQTNGKKYEEKNREDLNSESYIVDIGTRTRTEYGYIIDRARTIIWNGPMGQIEIPEGREGTDFVYYTVAGNEKAVSIVGGGDTLAAISKKEYIDQITWVSTGGGAMVEYIEKGSLPGIDALK
ncbi:MAG: phosphoglycerate kinase [Patescibacteria group bacterium]